jgi:capsid protein
MSLGVTYELLSGDYSGTNFSSGRMGHLSTERTIEVWRKDLIEIQFCRPFLRWALDAASIVGRQVNEVPVMWVPPRRAIIDPTKEIPALVLAIKAGLITWQAAVQQLGYDPAAQLESIKEIQTKMKEAGVELDVAPGQGEASKKKARKALMRMLAESDEFETSSLRELAQKNKAPAA